MLAPREQLLLERLAIEGKATKLLPDEIATARELELRQLLFIAQDTQNAEGVYAVVTPKGRKALAELGQPTKKKPPLGFLE